MFDQIKNLTYNIQKKWQGIRYRKELQKHILQVPPDGIYVNYGNVLPQNSSQIIQGGKVKLIHLQKFFPENSKKFNILYLVSSAQPPFAEEIVHWAKKHGAKFLWNQDGVAYPAWAGPNTRTQNEVLGRLIHLADYVIYQSAFCRSSADFFLGAVKAPSEILFNCVDTARFSPREECLPPSPWVLLTAGTHQQPERVLSVLQTIAVLAQRKREVRLILAGRLDWPQAGQQVKESIRTLGLEDRVIQYLAFTQEEAPDLYRQAHVCIHAKYKDPCPTVVVEALACGVPVIGSKSGGLPELVGQEGGILIDIPESWDQMHYPSPEKIADAVEYIFSDLSRCRQKARQRAIRHFDKKRWIEAHREIFRTILPHHC